MNATEMEVIRFNEADVIVASTVQLNRFNAIYLTMLMFSMVMILRQILLITCIKWMQTILLIMTGMVDIYGTVLSTLDSNVFYCNECF